MENISWKIAGITVTNDRKAEERQRLREGERL